MVNIQANDREDYFKQVGNREPELRELDALIQESAPHLEPILHGGMTGNWLAYGLQPYQTKSMKKPSEWPVVALAAQKNYISLYVMAVEDGAYIAEKYEPELGKVDVGKSCIRFKKLEDVNRSAVQRLLKGIDERFASGELLYSV